MVTLRKVEFIWMCAAYTEEVFVWRGWGRHVQLRNSGIAK